QGGCGLCPYEQVFGNLQAVRIRAADGVPVWVRPIPPSGTGVQFPINPRDAVAGAGATPAGDLALAVLDPGASRPLLLGHDDGTIVATATDLVGPLAVGPTGDVFVGDGSVAARVAPPELHQVWRQEPDYSVHPRSSGGFTAYAAALAGDQLALAGAEYHDGMSAFSVASLDATTGDLATCGRPIARDAATLIMKRTPRTSRVRWRMRRGPATTRSQLGNPLT